MKTSIATVCVSGMLLEKLEAISAADFKAVEIFENDLIAYPASPKEVRRICGDLGLKIVTCQPFRDFEGLPEEKRRRAFDRAERKFDLLQELGTDLLFVCSSASPEMTGGVERFADDFALLGERAARRGMRVGYEALAWGRQIFDYRDAWEVVRRANRDNVGLLLDTFHIQSRNIAPQSDPHNPARPHLSCADRRCASSANGLSVMEQALAMPTSGRANSISLVSWMRSSRPAMTDICRLRYSTTGFVQARRDQ